MRVEQATEQGGMYTEESMNRTWTLSKSQHSKQKTHCFHSRIFNRSAGKARGKICKRQ